MQDSNNLILYIKRVCVRLLREPIQVLGAIVCFVDRVSRCTAHYGKQMARCFRSTCHCARQFSSINWTIFEQIQLYEKIKTVLLNKNSAKTLDVFVLATCLTFANRFARSLYNAKDDCHFNWLISVLREVNCLELFLYESKPCVVIEECVVSSSKFNSFSFPDVSRR